jgi:hypothetical protein
LVVDGFLVDMRAVRLQNPIRRIGQYSCLIQLDRDLKTELTIDVLPDRALENFTAAAAAAEAVEEEAAPAADEPAAAAEAPKKGKKSKKD